MNEYAERQNGTNSTEQEMHKLNERGDGLSPHFTEKDHEIVIGDPPFRCFFLLILVHLLLFYSSISESGYFYECQTGQMHKVTMHRVKWRCLAMREIGNMFALRPPVG